MTSAGVRPGLAGRPGQRQPSEPPGFGAAYPAYASTGALDRLRATDYSYLESGGHIYLDYAGAGLAADAQLAAFAARMSGQCFGNPHSENPASAASTELVERARRAVLSYFNASADEYSVIFTPNASGACRLVGESYPFGPRTRLALTWDNHNSVNGLREFARARGAVTTYIPFSLNELRVDEQDVRAALSRRRPGVAAAAWQVAASGVMPRAGRGVRARLQRSAAQGWTQQAHQPLTGQTGQGNRARQRPRGLFAFPAQSNLSGVQHPLSWVGLAHDLGYDVLLDAAAFVPTNRLDLSAVRPDFVPVSFYKMFGFPTGAGCLLARREALTRLWRPWFSGGTIYAVSVQGDWHVLAGDETRFEDGTLNFLHIPDIEAGLAWISAIGIDVIHERVTCLTGWLLDRLGAMRHSNGQPMIRIYGPADLRHRGATIAFNLLDSGGAVVDERAVARDTAAAGISIRTGCFCNPGAGEGMLGLTRADVIRALRRRAQTVDEYIEVLNVPSAGGIRASFGLASNIADAERFADFLESAYRDRVVDARGLPPRLRCLVLMVAYGGWHAEQRQDHEYRGSGRVARSLCHPTRAPSRLAAATGWRSESAPAATARSGGPATRCSAGPWRSSSCTRRTRSTRRPCTGSGLRRGTRARYRTRTLPASMTTAIRTRRIRPTWSWSSWPGRR